MSRGGDATQWTAEQTLSYINGKFYGIQVCWQQKTKTMRRATTLRSTLLYRSAMNT